MHLHGPAERDAEDTAVEADGAIQVEDRNFYVGNQVHGARS
ncbi:hypothetical protein LC55x_5587 [Lysobacter capsici]|nr:hypothetical protein LC55x_5587 [Lysobacter capsici]